MMITHSLQQPKEPAGDAEVPLEFLRCHSSAVVKLTGEILGELAAPRSRKARPTHSSECPERL
jgi:hypothetical protein